MTYGKLKTEKQAERAEKIQEILFGPRVIRATIGPRPFMAPALDKGMKDFNRKYENVAQRAFMAKAVKTA